MKQITVRFIVTVIFVGFVQGCASVKPDPETGPNTEQGQDRERMNHMLDPTPNQ
jgi:hypothetical protein